MQNNLTNLQRQALEIISRHNKQKPITGLDITKRINLKERDSGKAGADMRSIIGALRRKGYPVCATGLGYYYARTNSGLSEFISAFQARIDKQQAALNGLKDGYDKLNLDFSDPGEILSPLNNKEEIIPKRKWRVESKKTAGLYYTVQDIGSIYVCDCPGFKYYRKCKHIETVKRVVQAEINKEIKNKQKPLL